MLVKLCRRFSHHLCLYDLMDTISSPAYESMSTSITSETKQRLAPLQCVNCNAPLVVVDGPTIVCRFCGAINVVPEVYREELRLARDLDSATRQAAEQWLRFAQIKVPRSFLICAAIAPFV